MVTATQFRILDPTVEPMLETQHLARRLDSLDSKVLGLYQNGKPNAAKLLEMVAEHIRGRFQLRDIVRGNYHVANLMRPDEWQGVERCDAVILANGD